MISSTLNVFQRLARQWDELHPYNAAQILKIEGVADPVAMQAAWHDALNDLGLGRVRLDGKSFSYECLNGEMAHYGVRVVPPGVTLDAWVSEQLNRRFDNPAEPPFRPFVLQQDGFYYAGVVYHHWVADSVSIRGVLREWYIRLFHPDRARRTLVKLADGGYRHFFGMTRSGTAVGSGLLSATRWASSLRRVRRVEVRNNNINLAVRWTMRTVEPGWIHELHAAARRRGVTLNDLFMAAIALVCDSHVPLKHRPRRHSLALGSIVDLRPYTPREMADAFGLFLGFTNIICRPDELRDREQLIATVSRQNRQQKHSGIPHASAMRMLAGVAAGRMMKPERMVHFYQKHLPLAGGISNVNMNQSWATEFHPRPLLDYIRVSPTGPLMPLVFATTTLGDDFHFALTYRPSLVPCERVEQLIGCFRDHLDSFC